MAENYDALFEQYAARVERKTQGSRGSYQQRTYEAIKWTGLETNKPKIIRAVGSYPDSNDDPSTAKTVTISWIVGDNGKEFRVIRPSNEEDPLHIINRIISKVTQARWVNNKKTFPVKEKFPDIYNIISRNGLADNDPKAKFERGWKGSEVLIINVIDRAQMDWHRENKHTMLLAKAVNEDAAGNVWPSEGVSSYAFGPKLIILFRAYGLWEKYDLAITKTGDKNTPFIISNASHSPMEVNDEYARTLINEETSLSDEEASWERYDLQKLFRVTSYTKIYNRLKNTIKRIDSALGTDFLGEIEKEVAKEKVEWEKLYGDEDEDGEIISKPEAPTVEDTPVRDTVPTREAVVTRAPEHSKELWEELPYGFTLSDDLKKAIVDVEKDPFTDKIINIKWSKDLQIARCDNKNCLIPSPLEADTCPVCGKKFS